MPGSSPVIIDTDPGVDDALALLLAGASPELEVLAVTTVGGKVGLDRATGNARRIVPVAWAGRAAPPIYIGERGGGTSAEAVHGLDGLGGAAGLTDDGGSQLYPAAAPVAEETAVEAILSIAERRPGEVTLIALGPLTNVAAALHRDRERLRGLKRVVVMGGAFREPGNVGPMAEFNIFADPEAAQAVCDSGLPLTWVPLDVTHRCLLTRDVLDALPHSAGPAGARATFARHITEFHMRYHTEGYGEPACFLHDPLAVGAVLWPELLRATPLRVNVETHGRFTRGMTIADFRPSAYRSPSAPNADVCLEVDAAAFVLRFVARLGG